MVIFNNSIRSPKDDFHEEASCKCDKQSKKAKGLATISKQGSRIVNR
jgi:hypothetical protein